MVNIFLPPLAVSNINRRAAKLALSYAVSFLCCLFRCDISKINLNMFFIKCSVKRLDRILSSLFNVSSLTRCKSYIFQSVGATETYALLPTAVGGFLSSSVGALVAGYKEIWNLGLKSTDPALVPMPMKEERYLSDR